MRKNLLPFLYTFIAYMNLHTWVTEQINSSPEKPGKKRRENSGKQFAAPCLRGKHDNMGF